MNIEGSTGDNSAVYKGSAFNLHPSKLLNELYQIRNYQGANPENAKILFVSRDPNWHFDIENIPVFEKVTEYLTGGISFWRKYGFHHPFLFSHYGGDEGRYHRMFSNLNLDSNLADKISFIELIGFPTTGMAKNFDNVFKSHLLSEENRKHLIQLDKMLEAKDKIIFIAWGLLKDFTYIKTGLFKNLSNIDRDQLDIKGLNQIDNIFIHKHFSDSISNATIAKISIEVNNYLK